jgi:hypothetical protein
LLQFRDFPLQQGDLPAQLASIAAAPATSDPEHMRIVQSGFEKKDLLEAA